MKIETKAVHAGRHTDPATGAVTPPIHLSTTFERQPDGSYPTGYEYTRDSNPNRNALEECVCALEGGQTAAAFSSGSVATMTIFQALSPGDHVIAPDDLYFGIRQLLGPSHPCCVAPVDDRRHLFRCQTSNGQQKVPERKDSLHVRRKWHRHGRIFFIWSHGLDELIQGPRNQNQLPPVHFQKHDVHHSEALLQGYRSVECFQTTIKIRVGLSELASKAKLK